MGEVYRATDSRLGREVAVKIIPEAFASDKQRMARFEREAQLLGALNHPNIATLYGLEESGGTRALVMELVEGPTLAERIALGRIPLEDVLTIAKQIAQALEFAHERGIIHRDLKPANVKITPDGAVKILDFGLAKAVGDEPASSDPSNSPTMSGVAGPLSRAGVILGTSAYMSPEQAKGRSVDKRADVWAFGVVLHEMLTGRRLFLGENASEVLAAVILKEPKWDALPPETPARLRNLLQRCLTKDPQQRLRDIGEARVAIEQYQAHPADDAPSWAAASIPAVAAAQPVWRRVLPWAMAGLLGMACLALLALWRPWSRSAQSPAIPMRLLTEIGADVNLQTDFGSSAVLSPDGTRIVLAVRDDVGKQQLYIRSLDQLQAAPLSGTEGARDPFFSPDGQWIAFFADLKLKKIATQGGNAVTLCDARAGRGGAWNYDNTIVFAPSSSGGLSRVSSAGGAPAPLASLGKESGATTHDRWPQVLPGGEAVLFTASTNAVIPGDYDLVVQVLATGRRKTVYKGGIYGRYLPGGHLVFLHDGTLFAVPFDLKRLETTGEPAPVVEQVISDPALGSGQFSFSQTGALAYLRGTSGVQDVSIDWLTADGKLQPLRQAPGKYYNPAFSSDGKFLALQVDDGHRSDIWTYDWQRDTIARLTFGGDSNEFPVWTPDGQRIAFSMQDKDSINLYWKRADGAGDAQRLTQSKVIQHPASWSPDGKALAFFQIDPTSSSSWSIYTLSMEGDEKTGWRPGESKPFLNTPASERYPQFSPDGRWLAYMSSESGNFEVYVRPFPGPGGKWQVSSGGGFYPTWSHTSKQLFYSAENQRIMAVTYSASGDSFQAGKPALWSDARFASRNFTRNFALHPDGKRFAVLEAPGTGAQPQVNKVVMVLNFFDELRRKFPQ